MIELPACLPAGARVSCGSRPAGEQAGELEASTVRCRPLVFVIFLLAGRRFKLGRGMVKQPRDEWLTISGLGFHYRDWRGGGQEIILLHGLASTCHIWDLVAPLLTQDDHRVVTMDQRRHGASTKPEQSYDFATVSRDLAGLIKSLGMERPLIVGHSWGADVALEFAVANPEVPKGLCFVDGGMIQPSARYASLDQAREQMAPPIFSGVTLEAFTQRVRSRQASIPMSRGAEAAALANFEVLPDNTIRAWLSRDNHLRIIDALWNHHPPELYPQVPCPVLLMPARQLGNSEASERLRRRETSVARAGSLLPRGKTVWLEDSVHDVPLQRPGLVAGIIKEHLASGYFN